MSDLNNNDVHSTIVPTEGIHNYYVKPLLNKITNSIREVAASADNERMAEVKRLTNLFNNHQTYSFIRLGDMDLTLLLAIQDGLITSTSDIEPQIINGTSALGGTGISTKHGMRFWNAFKYASYVDFHEVLTINEMLLPKLKLDREGSLQRNPNWETSYILPTWAQYEFKAFCEHSHGNIGIAGAEAGLLEFLSKDKIFQEAAKLYWPKFSNIYFHQVRESGRNLDQNMDLIKDDLNEFIKTNRIKTLFLSLGGAAKILCYELANEQQIRAIDFGVMIRALCDLGSDGHTSTRSTHSIMYYRLPFDLVMGGIEATQSSMKPEEVLAKSHAQLIHQLTFDNVGWSRGSRQLDFSPSARIRFLKGYLQYCKFYKNLRKRNEQCAQEYINFLHFCGSHFLTFRGVLFYLIFKVKSVVKIIIKLCTKSYVSRIEKK